MTFHILSSHIWTGWMAANACGEAQNDNEAA
jgi:hypothetical protein